MGSIVITGGAGFIGRHLVSKLKASSDHDIKVVDNLSPQVHGNEPDLSFANGTQFYIADIQNPKKMARILQDAEVVIHLASETGTGQSMYSGDRYLNSNITGTNTLLDAIESSNPPIKQIILASSRSVYGEGQYICENHGSIEPSIYQNNPLQKSGYEYICPSCKSPLTPQATSENCSLMPVSLYAATKLMQEQLVSFFCQRQGIDHTILRFQNVYGEGQSLKNPYTGILSIFSVLAYHGQPIEIYEDGKQSRDFIHVSDIIDVIYDSILQPKGPNFINVGCGIPVSVLDVAKEINLFFGNNGNIEMTNFYRQGDIRHNFADTSILAGKSFKFQKFSDGVNQFLTKIEPRLKYERSEYNKSRAEAIKNGVLKYAR